MIVYKNEMSLGRKRFVRGVSVDDDVISIVSFMDAHKTYNINRSSKEYLSSGFWMWMFDNGYLNKALVLQKRLSDLAKNVFNNSHKSYKVSEFSSILSSCLKVSRIKKLIKDLDVELEELSDELKNIVDRFESAGNVTEGIDSIFLFFSRILSTSNLFIKSSDDNRLLFNKFSFDFIADFKLTDYIQSFDDFKNETSKVYDDIDGILGDGNNLLKGRIHERAHSLGGYISERMYEFYTSESKSLCSVNILSRSVNMVSRELSRNNYLCISMNFVF